MATRKKFFVEGTETLLEVTFIGCMGWDNDGIGSYEYWGAKCYDKGTDYVVCDEIDWDHDKYSKEDNAAIKAWLDDEDNYNRVEEALCKEYEEDCKRGDY